MRTVNLERVPPSEQTGEPSKINGPNGLNGPEQGAEPSKNHGPHGPNGPEQQSEQESSHQNLPVLPVLPVQDQTNQNDNDQIIERYATDASQNPEERDLKGFIALVHKKGETQYTAYMCQACGKIFKTLDEAKVHAGECKR